MVTQNYTISTVKNAVPPKVKMSQYDSASRTIVFTVVDVSGAEVDLTGKAVTVEGTRIDGHAFVVSCTVDEATATFTETVDMTNQAGDHPAELVVRENGQRLGTMNFVISVEPCAMDEDAEITEEDKSLFEQLYGVGDAALTAAETLYQHILDNASAPIIYNTASGSVASFSDGADDYPIKELMVAVEPVQDLNGYDHPWPAGGGKNLLPMLINDIKSANTGGTWTGNTYVLSGVTFAFSVNSGGAVTAIAVSGTATTGMDINIINLTGSLPSWITPGATFTVSGNATLAQLQIIPRIGSTFQNTKTNTSFSWDSSWDGVFIRIRVDSGRTASGTMYPMVELGSTATSYAPYSNICPISGRTEAKVTRAGKNLIESTAYSGSTYNLAVGTEINLLNKSVQPTIDGNTIQATAQGWEGFNFITPPLRAGTYTVHFSVANTEKSRMSIYVVNSEDIIVDRYSSSASIAFTRTFTVSNGDYIVVAETVTTAGQIVIENLQVEIGDAYTEWADFLSQTYTISLGETVYGGTLDVVNGKMVVDRKCVRLDSLVWSKNPQAGSFNGAGLTDRYIAANYTNFISNAYKAYTSSAIGGYDNGIAFANAEPTVYVRDVRYTEPYNFVQYLTSVDAVVVYPLATPVEITLSPTQINTLLGANNIYSDAGSISEVEYPADTRLYINQAIATALASV